MVLLTLDSLGKLSIGSWSNGSEVEASLIFERREEQMVVVGGGFPLMGPEDESPRSLRQVYLAWSLFDIQLLSHPKLAQDGDSEVGLNESCSQADVTRNENLC